MDWQEWGEECSHMIGDGREALVVAGDDDDEEGKAKGREVEE